MPTSATGCKIDGYNVTLAIGPFALDAEKSPGDPQQEICAAVLRQRHVDLKAELSRFRNNREFGSVSLEV